MHAVPAQGGELSGYRARVEGEEPMNKNIERIIQESGLYIAYDNKEVTDSELAFFAEMIVRECAGINLKSSFQDGEFHAREVLEHFGVES